jgi:phosphoacetylglucosamine mutase
LFDNRRLPHSQRSSSYLNRINMASFDDAVRATLEAYPRPTKYMAYGTAGFRGNVCTPLNAVFARMGLLAAMRSKSCKNRPVGAMITASHNLECDNGLKIVDPDGGMMNQGWEPLAERLVNAETVDTGKAVVDEILSSLTGSDNRFPTPVVIIGRDTRPHSLELFECCSFGAKTAKCQVFDIGEVSTPQLHYVVHYVNCRRTDIAEVTQDLVDEAVRSYYHIIAGGFLDLLSTRTTGCPLDMGKLVVDCSFGVGSVTLLGVISALADKGACFDIEIRNASREGKVNDGCGAELVQKSVIPPANVDEARDENVLLCSYDGDADRIVFHSFLKPNGMSAAKWVLMDGDKIAALAASLIHGELVEAGLVEQKNWI